MNEWRKISLREVIEINPASVGSDFKAEWIEYIDISSVGEGAITESPKVIKLKEAPSRAKRLVSQNDTVISTVRPNRRSMFFAKEPKQNWVLSTGFAVLRPLSEKIEPRFLYASVFNREFTEYLISREKGAAYPAVLPEDIYEAEILLPPLPEQKTIASILSSLDDKIELNRRMNETLEAMARAIFKDWFVDFGPTRAKQEGRAAYLPEHLWSLFPEAIDVETGLPMGWEMSKIEEFMELAYGKSLTAKNRLPGDVVVYGSGGETGFHNEALISSPAVIVGRKGTVGSVYWEDRPVFPIDTVFYVIPKRTSLFFCYQLLINQPLSTMNTDAAVPGLNRNNAYRLEFPYPGVDLLNAYESITSPIWAQRGINLQESRALAELRDRLLPKLMSGEIRVKDAEKTIEEVL